jgi:hypothetical protein
LEETNQIFEKGFAGRGGSGVVLDVVENTAVRFFESDPDGRFHNAAKVKMEKVRLGIQIDQKIEGVVGKGCQGTGPAHGPKTVVGKIRKCHRRMVDDTYGWVPGTIGWEIGAEKHQFVPWKEAHQLGDR